MTIIVMWMCLMIMARFVERTWWSPGAMLALIMWGSAVGTLTLAPGYYMSFWANAYLAVMTAALSCGAALGRLIGRPSTRAVLYYRLERIGLLLGLGLFFSLLSLLFTFQAIGAGLGDILSPLGLMRVAQSATYTRYTEGLSFPIYYNISNAFVLAYAMIVAMVIAARDDTFRWILLAPLLIYVVSNMLITTRAPILFMLLLMIFTSIYAVRLRTGRFPLLFKVSVTKRILIGLGMVAGVFFLFQVLRFGEHSTRSPDEVWDHLRRWPWGSLPSFSLWFDGYGSSVANRVPGSYTFMGIFDNLGIEDRVTRGYEEYILLTATEPANVYTAFRGLYYDFGALGSAIFLFVVGLTCGQTLREPSSAFAYLSIYTLIMSFSAYAFVFSFWGFASNIFAAAIFPFVAHYVFDLKSAPPMTGKTAVHVTT